MSCANPKSAGWHDVQDKFNRIQGKKPSPFTIEILIHSPCCAFPEIPDVLSRLKPQLAVALLEPTDTLIKDLADVASLANSVAQWRSKAINSIGGGHEAWKEVRWGEGR